MKTWRGSDFSLFRPHENRRHTDSPTVWRSNSLRTRGRVRYVWRWPSTSMYNWSVTFFIRSDDRYGLRIRKGERTDPPVWTSLFLSVPSSTKRYEITTSFVRPLAAYVKVNTALVCVCARECRLRYQAERVADPDPNAGGLFIEGRADSRDGGDACRR